MDLVIIFLKTTTVPGFDDAAQGGAHVLLPITRNLLASLDEEREDDGMGMTGVYTAR